jgi:hypothetical protein
VKRALVVLPCIPFLGEKIKRIGSKLDVKVVFSSKYTLRSKLVHFKPRESVINKAVIYRIPCECGHCYVGERGRTVYIRINKHQNSIKKKVPDISKLPEHHFNTGYRILFEETEIIGKAHNWRARKIHEAAARWQRSLQRPECRDGPYLETSY